MTPNEQIVLREIAGYLECCNNPPAHGAANEEAGWEQAAVALSEMAGRCHNHPLMMEMGVAVYNYIEIKAKAKGEIHNETVHG